MRFRSIIIDDEETGIETLKMVIEKHIEDVRVVACSVKAKEAIGLIEDYMPEIVFLDISMPEMNGFEMLEQLSWKNFNLIFTTAHQEHALKALKINAVDYLLKPIDHRDLRFAIDKIKKQASVNTASHLNFDYSSLNNLEHSYTNRLALSSKDGIEYIDPLEIVSLESRSNYTQVVLQDEKTIITPKTLREFDTQLCGSGLNFMRVHHSFIINLHRVLRFSKEKDDIIMINNQKIPLAKSRRENFVRWLMP